VLLPPVRRLPPPRLLAFCRSETSVVPRSNSPRVVARGSLKAGGSPGLALRVFKTAVDMT
jgi:hypothetical protein